MSVVLAIAGQRCAIEGSAALVEAVRLRYAGFVAEGAPDGLLRVTTAEVFAPDYAAPAELGLVLDGDVLRFSGCAEGEVDLATGTGRIDGIADLGPLDAALRALVVTRAPERDVLVMHGALVIEQDRARVLVGASGSGKSTAARALGAISDELVALRWNGARFVACATPYWGGRPAEAELGSLVILERDEHGAGERRVLRGAEALRALSQHVVRYVDRARSDHAVLGLLARLATLAPLRLRLPVGAAFLPALDDAMRTIEASS